MRLARIFCAALSVLSVAVAADDFEQLRNAVARGDYSAAVPALQAAAEHDDPRAIGLLASLYQQGQGFPHDAAKALSLYTRAAELGDAQAQFALGNSYLLGDGVPVDEAWALTYYRQAAAQGHVGATRKLDELYRAAGLSPSPASPRPPARATVEARSTAPSGPSDDELRAIELARAAGVEVMLDETAASPAVPMVLMTRPATPIADPDSPPAFTPSSVATDPDTMENNEEGAAAYDTAQRYLRGQGVARDPAIGIQWLQRAARAGHTQAKYDLALHYLNGQDVIADEAMAITLLRDAAQAGHPLARAKLKQVYAAAGLPMPELTRPQQPVAPAGAREQTSSVGPNNATQSSSSRQIEAVSASIPAAAPAVAIPATLAAARTALDVHDLPRAAAIFTTLAEHGNAEAQAQIGYMTYQGEGVPVDKAKAVQWYRKAAVQGNRDAQYNLAVAYAFGDSVARNDAEALLWYRRAAEQGSAIAQYSLGMSYALGEGAAQSDEEAIKWYSAAAEQGYADAQYKLGNIYREGNGVERDLTEAMHWYKLAAAQGHREAQADLAALQASR